jgi:hypothetical protein
MDGNSDSRGSLKLRHLAYLSFKRRFSMNKSSIRGLLCGLAGTALIFAYPRLFPTGVTLYDPARAYNSFVLFATAGTVRASPI